jgi:general secretion pathway protein D
MIRLSGREGLALIALAALGLPLLGPGVHAQTTDPRVRSTILRGTLTAPPPPPAPSALAKGDVTLNYPSVDVQIVAKALLGDILNVKYTIDPSIHGVVTVQTAQPIRRIDVLALFEESLRNANLALINRQGTYAIVPLSAAQGVGSVIGPADTGFGDETIALKYANAEELKKLLDPIVPNAIAQADAARNILVVAGNTTQRNSIRELVKQFDVDWLRGMSFAIYIPQRTDSRLIAPELDKLINAPGSQTAGMVRLITMEHLNGILAISAQPQYLEDVRRWVEVLDREGEDAERRLFVYHVQNGRAIDLTKVLDGAFGLAAPKGGDSTDITDAGVNGGGLGGGGGGNGSHFSVTGGAGAQGGANQSPTIIQLSGGANRSVSPQVPTPNIGNQLDENAASGAQQAADQNGTTITADETNNAILVYSTPRNYALIEDALRHLDVPPLEVLIDAVVSEISLDNNLQYGIQWYLQDGSNTATLSQTAINTASTTTTTTDANGNPVTTTVPGSPFPSQILPGFSYVFQHRNNVYATLNALRAVTDVHVLSAPKLMVLNNHTASIEVGDQVPISTGSAVSTVSDTAPIVNSIDYRDVGVILKVTPRVNSSGLVLLDIAQEVSDVIPQTAAQALIQSPSFSERKLSTSVAVQDGETIVLGGLIKNEVTRSKNRIPLLGDIPYMGALFGSTGKEVQRTELVVLLTPRVIRTPVDADAITADLKAKMQLAEPAPPPPPPGAPEPGGRHGG